MVKPPGKPPFSIVAGETAIISSKRSKNWASISKQSNRSAVRPAGHQEWAEMPGTRRTPIARSRTPLITAHTVDLFRTALRLRKSKPGSLEAHEAERAVDRMVGWKMWNISLWDFDIYSREKPPEDRHLHRDWQHALELRLQLEAAVRALRRSERAVLKRGRDIEQPEPTPPPSS
jgi:hypothetical protein